MDEQVRAELRTLRARAYGPEADIQADPAAAHRLAQLESLIARTPSATTATADADRGIEAPVEVLVDEPPAEPAPSASVPAPDAPRRPWWRRTAVMWTASVIVAVLAGALIEQAVSRAVDGEVAVLDIDLGAERPSFLGSRAGTAVVYDDYLDLTVVGGLQAGNDESGPCMAIVRSDDILTEEQSLRGPYHWGCGAGEYSAVVQLVVSESSPERLRERFPVGTSLSFQQRGTQVVVRAIEP